MTIGGSSPSLLIGFFEVILEPRADPNVKGNKRVRAKYVAGLRAILALLFYGLCILDPSTFGHYGAFMDPVIGYRRLIIWSVDGMGLDRRIRKSEVNYGWESK